MHYLGDYGNRLQSFLIPLAILFGVGWALLFHSQLMYTITVTSMIILGLVIWLDLQTKIWWPFVSLTIFLSYFSFGDRIPVVSSILDVASIAFLFCSLFSLQRKRFRYAFILPVAFWMGGLLAVSLPSWGAVYPQLRAFVILIAVSLRNDDMTSNVIMLFRISLASLILWASLEFIFFRSIRLSGPMVSATIFGVVIATFWSGLAGWFLCSTKKQMIDFFLLFFGLVSMFLTGTRSALLAILFALICYPFLDGRILSRKRIFRLLFRYLLAFSILISVWTILPDDLFLKKSFQSLNVASREIDMSSMGRLIAWYVAYKSFLLAPFFGHGLGSFPALMESFVPGFQLMHAHSVIFNTLAENGLFGVLCVFLFYASILIKVYTDPASQTRTLLLSAVLSLSILSFFDYVPLYPSSLIFGAVIFGVCLQKRNESRGEH